MISQRLYSLGPKNLLRLALDRSLAASLWSLELQVLYPSPRRLKVHQKSACQLCCTRMDFEGLLCHLLMRSN